MLLKGDWKKLEYQINAVLVPMAERIKVLEDKIEALEASKAPKAPKASKAPKATKEAV